MKSIYKLFSLAGMVALLAIVGCKKETALTIPAELATFMGKSGGNYSVQNVAGDKFEISVGYTTVSSNDRTINFNVSSPTGATAGTQYTLSPASSITIPAGETIGKITVNGIFSQYNTGRKDSLIFTISDNNDARATNFDNKFSLFMRGPCFESDMVLNEMRGTYANTNEVLGTSAYGPYTTTISAVNQTGPTTGTVTVTNIFDFGWNPIQVNLDWTNPAAVVATIPTQSGIGDAGTISATYAGQDISVRSYAGRPSTYSFCNKTLLLEMQLGVTGLGWFGSTYTVNMAR